MITNTLGSGQSRRRLGHHHMAKDAMNAEKFKSMWVISGLVFSNEKASLGS